MDAYVLRRGHLGALRLAVLAQAAGPGSTDLLNRLPWHSDWHCLDVGCGLGFVTRELARRAPATTGVDSAAEYIKEAQCLGGAEYRLLDVSELHTLPGRYDLVYARYLLSHLTEPSQAVNAMAGALTSGGWLVLEDVDFPGHSCDPPCPAFQRYLDLYQGLLAGRGGDACIGRRLWRLAAQAGLEVSYSGVNLPLQRSGAEKRVAELTLGHIRAGLIESGLATRAEVAALLVELRAFRRADTQLSLAPTFQLIARK